MRRFRLSTPELTWLLAAAAVVTGASVGAAAATAAAPSPRADLFVVRSHVTAVQAAPSVYESFPVVVYLINRGGPVEAHVRRTPGTGVWTAQQVVDGAPSPMPPDVRVGPAGLDRAVVVTVLDRSRAVVRRAALDVCLNDAARRLGPAGPGAGSFPEGCVLHPFARGLRMGLDTGYGVPFDLTPVLGSVGTPGRYTVRVRMRRPAAEWLGMAPRDRAVTLSLRLLPPRPRAGSSDGGDPGPGLVAPAPTHRHGPLPRVAPPATDVVPPAGTLPDLAALPAFGISTGLARGRDTLEFGATVWNAGPGPMIVEGYRQGRTPRMSAHQFFRLPGTRDDVASVPVGSLEYDARAGHDHWHFRDFARYSLTRADGTTAATSPKEAWCLAPTDQIDQLLPDAEIRPGDPFLSSACGNADAAQVAEVLEVGAGDTYGAGTPGQAIDITRLRNGTYFLKIEANPSGVLRETTATDNVSLRRIVLGGAPGRRTVRVPPAEGIDSERLDRHLSATCAYCGFLG